ncbi:MAG: M48 family peptidase [Bacteroidetes bacterium]|nr:MAG: M48 family peptidase [Bacteroidota bacterium]
MKTKILYSLLVVMMVSACSKVPITKRKQLNILPESQLMSMSLTSYRDFLKDNPPVMNTPEAAMVKTVGTNISNAVTRYMNQNGQGSRIQGYAWEFNLVNSPEANAWCMSGGKVVVYKGLLPLTLDASGLAIVMGHEVAHAVARHGNERMSQQLAAAGLGIGIDLATSGQNPQIRNIFLASYGIGSTLGVLAYSRLHETEADKLGLIFAAMAGYDPQKAVSFWERMAAKGGAKPPELLSTHPSDQTRIKNLKDFMPTALKYYKPTK